jgi:hypothetical protein
VGGRQQSAALFVWLVVTNGNAFVILGAMNNAILMTVRQGVSNTPVTNFVLFSKVEDGRKAGNRTQGVDRQ